MMEVAHGEVANNNVADVIFVEEDYTQKHVSVTEMFPELDLTQTFKEYGHMSSGALAELVLENMATLPKKARGVKRPADFAPTTSASFEYGSESDQVSSDEDENTGSLLRDKMIGEMLSTLKMELHKAPPLIASTEVVHLISDLFPAARSEFIKRIVGVFEGKLVASALACFFAQNKFGYKVQKYAQKLPQKFWCQSAKPINTRRKSKKLADHDQLTAAVRAEFGRYQKVMERFRKKYPDLFDESVDEGYMSKNSNLIELDQSNSETKLECLVCFDDYPLSKMICCNVPVSNGLNDTSAADESTASSSIPSALLADHFDDSSNHASRDGEDVASKEVTLAHSFCRVCIRGQAVAATEDIPLAEGGVGLKCMVPKCANPILYSEVRHLLKKDIRKKLDERIIEENLGLASLLNLERCPKCNFGMEMDVPPEVNKVFACLGCKYEFCRLCKSDWDDDHIGVTCDELSVKQKKNRKDRQLEQQLNEAIIRKCPKCSLAFTKSEGCNKMTCRCGQTQCYICRESNINYTHFCQHFRDPNRIKEQCKECTRTCLLWEDSVKHDEKTIEAIKKKVAEEEAAAGASSSSAAVTVVTPEDGNKEEFPRNLPGMVPNAYEANDFDFMAMPLIGRMNFRRPLPYPPPPLLPYQGAPMPAVNGCWNCRRNEPAIMQRNGIRVCGYCNHAVLPDMPQPPPPPRAAAHALPYLPPAANNNNNEDFARWVDDFLRYEAHGGNAFQPNLPGPQQQQGILPFDLPQIIADLPAPGLVHPNLNPIPPNPHPALQTATRGRGRKRKLEQPQRLYEPPIRQDYPGQHLNFGGGNNNPIPPIQNELGNNNGPAPPPNQPPALNQQQQPPHHQPQLFFGVMMPQQAAPTDFEDFMNKYTKNDPLKVQQELRRAQMRDRLQAGRRVPPAAALAAPQNTGAIQEGNQDGQQPGGSGLNGRWGSAPNLLAHHDFDPNDTFEGI